MFVSPLVRRAIRALMVSLGVYTLVRLFIRNCPDRYRWLCSVILSAMSVRPALVSSHTRGHFSELNVTIPGFYGEHTHPDSATNRSAAVSACKHLAQRLGLDYYSYQMSTNDQRHEASGSRNYYFIKDVDIEPRPTVWKQSQRDRLLVSFIDVDYYVDMPAFMSDWFTNIALYTFVPSQAASSATEAAYHFANNGDLVMSISGGAEYRHKLWDYGHDCVSVSHGIGIAVYKVDRKQLGPDRQLIFLSPVAKWTWLASALASYLLEMRPLVRFNPVDGDFVRFSRHSRTGVEITTGQVGTYASATISAQSDAQLSLAASNSSVPISVHTVMSIAKLPEDQSHQVLVAYHRRKAPSPGPKVYAISEGVHYYQPVAAPYFEESSVTVRPFMSMIVSPAYAHLSSRSMDESSIKLRVTDVAVTNRRMSPLTMSFAVEFINAVFPKGAFTLSPIDEVYEAQHRPSQRRLLAEAEMVPVADSDTVLAFDKKDPAQGADPSRNISTVHPVNKVTYAMVIYPLAKHLKTKEWYAFGRTPRSIAERVASIATRARVIVESDCSKMDGRVGPDVRELEKVTLSRAYRPEDAEFALKCHSKHYNQKAKTRNGIVYQTKFSRLSGAAETSFFNTMLNAEMAYCTFRHMGHDHDTAISLLGIYGGDDGGTPDIDVEKFCKVAAEFGQLLTPIVKARGETLKFLARIYGPDVWWGDTNSCCDIRRQLLKFHVTPNVPTIVKPIDKLVQKCRSFIKSDHDTPVIGDICRAVEEIAKDDVYKTDQAISRWFDSVEDEEQYPNVFADWMLDHLLLEIPTFQWREFKDFIDKVWSLDQIISMPTFAEPEPIKGKGPYLVDPDSVAPTDVTPKPTTTITPSPHPVAAAPIRSTGLPAADCAICQFKEGTTRKHSNQNCFKQHPEKRVPRNERCSDHPTSNHRKSECKGVK